MEVEAPRRDALAPRPRYGCGLASCPACGGTVVRRLRVGRGQHGLGTRDVPLLVHRGSPGVCDGLSAVATSLAARGAPSPVPAMAWPAGRTRAPAADDAAAEQLVTTVRDLDVGSALADPWAAQTSDSAETANSTAYPLYYLMATGWRSRRTPWKPCGLCTRSGTYKTPQTYWWSSCNTQGDSACSEPPIRRGPTAWSSALS